MLGLSRKDEQERLMGLGRRIKVGRTAVAGEGPNGGGCMEASSWIKSEKAVMLVCEELVGSFLT